MVYLYLENIPIKFIQVLAFVFTKCPFGNIYKLDYGHNQITKFRLSFGNDYLS